MREIPVFNTTGGNLLSSVRRMPASESFENLHKGRDHYQLINDVTATAIA